MKIQYRVQSLYLLIGVTHTTRNYSINEEKITTLLEITRVPSNFLLPYPTLLGFEKPLLVIAWQHASLVPFFSKLQKVYPVAGLKLN